MADNLVTLANRIKECDDAYCAELFRPLLADPKDYAGLANGILRLTSESHEDFIAYLRSSDEYAAKHQPIPAAVPISAPIAANFCGHLTPWGEKCFDIFLAAWTPEQRKQVYEQKRSMGLKHIVLAIKGGYHGTNNFDFTQNPEMFLALCQEVLDAGFCPIVFLSEGATGADVDAYFARCLSALAPVHMKCHWVPGWELVGPGGGWTSAEFAHGIQVMQKCLPYDAAIWAHLVDDRATFASWPIETDDPWAGDEIGAWKSHGGERLTGLLFQSVSGRALLQADQEPVGDLGLRGWRNRAYECKIRLVDGHNGWRRVRMAAFETVAYDYYWGNCDDADVKRLAVEARNLGFTEFGNGLP